ncbi:MAG: [protein-PII] uridylyltransferase, partial [Pseudonocardiaceae bacterium]
RDLDDPATARRVVDTLGGDRTLLELLVALAEADAVATGPGVWTEWRAGMISHLAERCRAVLVGQPVPAPEPLTAEQRALAQRSVASGSLHVAATVTPNTAAAGPGAVTTIMVVTPGRPGVLALAAGVLALHSLQVHSADIRVVELGAGGSAAMESFTVSPRFGRSPDVALLRQDLVRALDGTLGLAEALAAKERDYGETPSSGTAPESGLPGVESRVLWFDDEATGAVILELRTTNHRIGLLYRVAAALESSAVTVRWARIATLGSSVVDSFCLTGTGGCGALPPEARERLERAVLCAVR